MSEYINLALDYLSLFYGEFDPVAFFLSVFKYTVFGLILCFILVIVCVKSRFFRRQNKHWNNATNLYFILIPVVCIGGGAAFGLLQYPKEITNKTVAAVLQPVKQGAVDYMQSLPQEVQDNLSLVSVKKLVRSHLADNFGIAIMDDGSEGGGVTDKLFRMWLINYITNAVLDKVNEKIASATGLEKKDVNKLWQQNLIDIFKGDFLNDLVSNRLNKTINSFQNLLLLVLLLLLLVPTADILIAKRLEKRTLSKQQCMESA
jgi:hypothetical protein